MHRGADDNASGVAATLEIAQYLADQRNKQKVNMRRDILFALWSGEELGLRGSQAFTESFGELYSDRLSAAKPSGHPHSNPHESTRPVQEAITGGGQASVESSDPHATDNPHAGSPRAPQSLYPHIAACLNLDMVGRLRDKLILQGIGSSPYWAQAIEQRNTVVRLAITLQQDCNLPTDASTFYLRGVPILSAFTGAHAEYHTPRDVPELLNYQGAAEIAKLLALITRGLVTDEQPPEYHEQKTPPETRANLTAYLGTVPDYAQDDIQGVKLSGVTKGAPAADAGLEGGDVIVELAGRTIENIYDYTYAIEALKIGQETGMRIRRGDETLELTITPASRQ